MRDNPDSLNPCLPNPKSIYHGSRISYDWRFEKRNGIAIVGEADNQPPTETIRQTLHSFEGNVGDALLNCTRRQLLELVQEAPRGLGLVMLSAFSPRRKNKRISDIEKAHQFAWQLREHTQDAHVAILTSLSPKEQEIVMNKGLTFHSSNPIKTVNTTWNMQGPSEEGDLVHASRLKMLDFLDHLSAISEDNQMYPHLHAMFRGSGDCAGTRGHSGAALSNLMDIIEHDDSSWKKRLSVWLRRRRLQSRLQKDAVNINEHLL